MKRKKKTTFLCKSPSLHDLMSNREGVGWTTGAHLKLTYAALKKESVTHDSDGELIEDGAVYEMVGGVGGEIHRVVFLDSNGVER